jgi:hypothetical protein
MPKTAGAPRKPRVYVKQMNSAWRFDMKALSKLFVLLLATIGLASCGGGGGGSSGAFTPTPSDTIEISAAATSIPTNNFTTLTVTVKKHDGSFENDGTSITASVTPSTIGTVSGATGTPAGTSATNTLAGGHTTFNFTSSNQVGTATITISVPAGTNGSTTVATKSVPITVVQGSDQDPRLQLTPTEVTLPLNPYIGLAQVGPQFVTNYLGSPYIAEVTLTWRHSNGQLVNGTSTVNVSIDPTTLAGFSQLDDPTTQQSDPTKPDGNEFLTILGSGPVNVTGGNGVIFIHSANVPGTGTLTVTAIDPDNNQTISSQLHFTVAGAASNLPSSISFATGGAVYVSNSGGPQSTVLNAQVTDGNDANVPDPDGFDNVQFQITSPNTDARLSGLNAAGQAVVGNTVNTVTHNGVAAVTFQAGSVQGPVQVKVTADRADNNVDNGIQDPVSSTATVIVSDGILYSLTLATPVLDAIRANSVSGNVTETLPGDPDATYSFTVSATGVDRQGNPPLPGTVIKFGSIDAPQSNGVFSISGTQGNPQEAGTLFTATDGHFRTAGGGAGPGDTLIVFGKHEHGAPEGNADLESAAKIARINSETSLNTVTPFNRNDTTGVIVDNGPVLPYVIGRAQTGNISSPSVTNSLGTATTTLNYPVSVLGRELAIWAQGTGVDNITGGARTVTDAALIVFPGIAPATIFVSPTPIPGNRTLPVNVCIIDAAQNPVSGVHFNFIFTDMGAGSGKVDGIGTAGVVPDATGPDGCVTTTVFTTGIGTGGTPTLNFSFGAASTDTPIVISGSLTLLANPSFLGGGGGKVTLTLLSSDGGPVPGVKLFGTCEGDSSIQITAGPGITDANGQTTATITANLNKLGAPGSGSCRFTTSEGTPSATVQLEGINLCTTQFSPECPGQEEPTVTLTITSGDPNLNISASVTSAPAGISCSASDEPFKVCSVAVAPDTYTLTPVFPTGFQFAGWSGSCAPVASEVGDKNTARVIASSGDVGCTLVVEPAP